MAEVFPRIEGYVGVDGPGGHLGIAVQQGAPSAALNVMVRALAGVMTKTRTTVGEVRHATQLLGSERALRVAEASQPLIAELKKSAKVFASEAARIADLSTTSWVKAYGAGAPYWAHTIDLAMLAKFGAQNPSAQKVEIERAKLEPAQHLALAEMAMRLPRELTGISHEDHSALRLAVLRQFDPVLAESIAVQREQVTQAQKALQIAMQVLAESGVAGAATELRTTEPVLDGVLQQ